MNTNPASLILGIGCAFLPGQAIAQNFDIIGDIRARYETVEQTGKDDAESLTIRSRFGIKWDGESVPYSFLVEVENNISIIEDDRNTSIDRKPNFATVNDPDFTELNRVQLQYEFNDDLSFTLGRQYVGFDGNRIVGSPGWRQDKNSHDAFRLDYASGGLTASYVYHWQLNRNPGDDFNWDIDAHLFNANYKLNDAFKFAGFVYFVDVPETGRENLSNLTWGGRLTGQRNFGALDVSYDLMAATQSDYGQAEIDFSNSLFDSGIAFSHSGARVAFGYDVVTGDGTVGFANPLASNHGTAGWSDVFHGGGRAAPANGLKDFHVDVSQLWRRSRPWCF